MKIGILTYHRALNYGAFLQAYALKCHIESLGCKVDMIDYWPKEHEIAYDPYYIQKGQHIVGYIKDFIYNLLRYRRYVTRMQKMQQLREKYLCIPNLPKYRTGAELVHLDYDCIIYGSDQIWWRHSPIASYPGFDAVYWGEYTSPDTPKIAYAASMGRMDLDHIDIKFITQKLNNFRAISVREESLRLALQPLTSTPIYTTVDPTLLVGKSFWNKYANYPTPKEKYVLLYSLLPSKEAEQLARKKAKELHCKYIEITGSVKPLKIGNKYIQTADAFEFISYIRNAEYVVTTSFHGTAFAILFEKQFCALGMGKNSSRVASLLSQLHIIDRLIQEGDDLPKNSIDYTQVNQQLQKLILPSMQYLKDAIQS